MNDCRITHIWNSTKCPYCEVEGLRAEHTKLKEHYGLTSEERAYLQTIFNREERELKTELKNGTDVIRAKRIIKDLAFLDSMRVKLML